MTDMPSGYSENELSAVWRAIAPPPPPAPPEFMGAAGTPPPEWMLAFWKLADLAPELYWRLAADPWVEALSRCAFFPVAQGRPIPELRMTGRTRGPVAVLRSGAEAIAIKPFQNSREDEIARIAADAGAGPAQLPSLPGYLTERFAEGVFFTDLLLDRHPEYSREEVHNFARTLPMYRIFAGMIDSRAEMDNFLREYGNRMAQASREDILARDLKFVQQGLSIAARRLGQDIIPPLRDGFLEAYRPVG